MAVVTIGMLARKLIKQSAENKEAITNEQLAAKVVKIFADNGVEAKTSAACIAWYKNDMRKKGELVGGTTSRKAIEIDLDEV